jgi:hypothetical protein
MEVGISRWWGHNRSESRKTPRYEDELGSTVCWIALLLGKVTKAGGEWRNKVIAVGASAIAAP